MHDSVLHNCKKHRIPFKRTTKDPNKIFQRKIYMWEIYPKMSPNKIFMNFLAQTRHPIYEMQAI